MSSATKKKSTSQTNLPDGSRVKEYVVEETNPDGSKTITTTKVKTSKVKRMLPDGSHAREDVSTTTTTTKHVPPPHQGMQQQQQQQDGNVIVNAVGTFMDLFGGGGNKQGAGAACGAGSVLGGVGDDDSTDNDVASKVAGGGAQQQHQQDHRRGGLYGPPPPQVAVFDDVSTLGGDQTAAGEYSHDDPWEAGDNDGQRQWQQQRQLQRQQQQRQQQQQQQPQQQAQRNHRYGDDQRDWGGRETLAPGGHHPDPPAAFYQKNQHTNGGSPYYAKEDAGYGNGRAANDAAIPGSYNNDNFDGGEDCGGNESVCGENFVLYENDRLETQLPTFHRTVPASVGSNSSRKSGGAGSVGRTIMKKLTPLGSGMSGGGGGSSNQGSDGSHTGSSSGRRLNALTDRSSPGYQQRHHHQQQQQQRASHGGDVGISQYQPPRQQQQQRGRSSASRDKHELDPEVVNAIEMIRQRSKSPPRGRREYLPPRSPASPRAAGIGAPSPPRENAAREQGYGLPPHLADHNEWDEDARDERDDFSTFDGVGSNAPTPRPMHKSRTAVEVAATPTTKKGGKIKKQQFSTMKRIQGRVPIIPPPTMVKYGQALLTKDSFTTSSFAPKIVIHKTNAILTSDRYVHFYSLVGNKWAQTTSVSLPNTQGLSFAICNNTAVVGVPYDRNSKGLLTGAAYIFERDAKTQTWYQVKKIVPKKAREFANVGYSVDMSENVVCVGVPELGAVGSVTGGGGGGGGGSVYVYQRAEQYKWMPMGHLTMAIDNLDPNCLAPAGGSLAPTTTNFGTIVTLKNKVLVISNYQPNEYGGETSLFVYEYDNSLKNKWRLIQTDMLSTEVQRRNFGSRIALTSNGEGIFIGCHSDVNPTEILYYKRKAQVDPYGNRSYQLQQIITLQEKCNISDFCIDLNDNIIVGTLNSNRVYVYQNMHDLITLEDQGWKLVAKVTDANLERQRFGENVGIYGDSILVGTKGNVYTYSLEKWLSEARKNRLKTTSTMRSSSPSMWGKIRGVFAG